MGEKITFPWNASGCDGYLARPAGGRGPAIVVIQEWWGLVPHIEDLVDRFAREGFLALAPDLYHGKTTTSPDAAARLLMELDADRACSEISGAGAYLLAQPDCASARYGVVGFCMGGGLAQYVATKDPSVGAGVSFYGGFVKVEYDWKALSSPLLLIYAENDKGVPASQAGPLAKRLQALGKDVETVVYPDADHGFFNDTRPSVYKKDAAEDAWLRTLAFFRDNLVGA